MKLRVWNDLDASECLRDGCFHDKTHSLLNCRWKISAWLHVVHHLLEVKYFIFNSESLKVQCKGKALKWGGCFFSLETASVTLSQLCGEKATGVCCSDKERKKPCSPPSVYICVDVCVCPQIVVFPRRAKPRALFPSGLIWSDVRSQAPRRSVALGVWARRWEKV